MPGKFSDLRWSIPPSPARIFEENANPSARLRASLAEFDTEDRMLFPYEILAFLRLREWQGLVNPEVFEHPLMQQPLTKLPKDVPLAVPETPLLDQVVVKFQQEYPGSFA